MDIQLQNISVQNPSMVPNRSSPITITRDVLEQLDSRPNGQVSAVLPSMKLGSSRRTDRLVLVSRNILSRSTVYSLSTLGLAGLVHPWPLLVFWHCKHSLCL